MSIRAPISQDGELPNVQQCSPYLSRTTCPEGQFQCTISACREAVPDYDLRMVSSPIGLAPPCAGSFLATLLVQAPKRKYTIGCLPLSFHLRGAQAWSRNSVSVSLALDLQSERAAAWSCIRSRTSA